MAIVEGIDIKVSTCVDGAFIRWYYNGWHYKLFPNRYTTEQVSKSNGVQVVEKFSSISKVEKNTSRKNDVFISFGIDNVSKESIEIYKGLLIAETVQLYQYTQWVNLEINRGSFTIRPTKLNRFNIDCTAWVKEILSASQLIVPPTEAPATTWTWTDSFDSWEGSLPYSRKPVGWTQLGTPTATAYVVDVSNDAEFHVSQSGVFTGSCLKYDMFANQSKLMTGSIEIEFEIVSLSGSCQFSVQVLDAGGVPCDASYNVTSLGVKKNVFVLSSTGRYVTLQFIRITSGSCIGLVSYFKVTQL